MHRITQTLITKEVDYVSLVCLGEPVIQRRHWLDVYFITMSFHGQFRHTHESCTPFFVRGLIFGVGDTEIPIISDKKPQLWLS